MLFDTRSTQAAQASLDSLWIKTKVISNNLANVDTPGFKSSSVSFESALGRASASVQNREGQQVPENASGRRSGFRTTVSTDNNSAVRVDGNNVVLEKEQSELWKTYAQYSYLLDRVSGHYRNINSVISNMKG